MREPERPHPKHQENPVRPTVPRPVPDTLPACFQAAPKCLSKRYRSTDARCHPGPISAVCHSWSQMTTIQLLIAETLRAAIHVSVVNSQAEVQRGGMGQVFGPVVFLFSWFFLLWLQDGCVRSSGHPTTSVFQEGGSYQGLAQKSLVGF